MPLDRPNVLVFIPHDLGDTLNCYGHEQVRSPHIDGLAEDGVRFSEYFCVSPECTSSRGGMMTGMHCHRNGLVGLANFGWELRVPHLARRLRDAGYATHLFSYQHETFGALEGLGYEYAHGLGRKSIGDVCEPLRAFLRTDAARGPQPWFAYVGCKHVHRPWADETTFDPADIEIPPYLPDNETIRRDFALFYQNILDMDAAVGRVFEDLEALGLAEDTLVVFTTDHGPAFPHAKATLYDPGLRIPLIVRQPGRFDGGRVHDALLSNVDFTPTVLDLCGAGMPDDLDGRTFAPLLRGEPYASRDVVFASLFYDVSYDPMHAVRTRAGKYIRSFAVTPEDAAGADPEVLATFVAGHWIRVDDFDVMANAAWQSMKMECPKPPREELYDLVADPWEQVNRAEDPEAAGELAALRGRLDEWMRRTESPLLTGHVAPTDRQRMMGARHRPGGPLFKERGL